MYNFWLSLGLELCYLPQKGETDPYITSIFLWGGGGGCSHCALRFVFNFHLWLITSTLHLQSCFAYVMGPKVIF